VSEFLEQLAEELRTQDNLATAYPLYCVQQKRRIVGMDPQFDFLDFEWHSCDHEYRYSNDEIQEIIREDIAREEDMDVKDVEVFDRNPEDYEWEQVYYVDIWEFVCAHLTMKAANRYIDENRHNLKDPRVYVTSQHRCPEWQEAVRHLSDLERPFEPNWASAPGETIADCIEHVGMSRLELGEQLGLCSMKVKQLFEGELAITPALAEKLEQVVGSTAQFWLNREANYRVSLARIYKKES